MKHCKHCKTTKNLHSQKTRSGKLTICNICKQCRYKINNYVKYKNKCYSNKKWLYDQYATKQLSTKQIAKKCNVSDVTIQNALKRFQISIRSASEQKKLSHKLYKQTMLQRYGVEYTLQSTKLREKGKKTKEILYQNPNYTNKDKQKQTKKERYGNSNYNNPVKQKQTRLSKYGVEHALQHDKFKKKAKKTLIKNYGTNNPMKSKEIQNKQKQTCIKKYGVDNPLKSKEIQNQNRQIWLKNIGVDCPFKSKEIQKKRKQTWIKKYNVNNPMKCKIIQNKFRQIWDNKTEEEIKCITHKNYQTKKQNNSFNTSKPEQEILNFLKQYFPNIKYQYKDDIRYPFICDFYISEYDLFIEYNGSWTHGLQPYDPNNINHLKKINKWLKKSENSKYYQNALHVFTKTDPKKREYAKNNNLKYLELWSYDYNQGLQYILNKIINFINS